MFLILLIVDLNICLNAQAQPKEEEFKPLLEIYIDEVAKEFDLSPYLLASLIYQESRFIVKDNLTQIMGKGKWHKEGIEYTGNNDLSNEYNNIRICGYYLKKWAEEYPGEPTIWLNYWNKGHYSETETYYTRAILRRAEKWESEESIDGIPN